MPVNPYFQSGSGVGRSSEQLLLENLIIESLKVYGLDMYYLPRQLVKEDQLFGEDVLSKFDFAVPLEMYVKNVNGFGGDGDFVRSFGLEIRDRATFVVARARWDQAITQKGMGILTRPSEGDLIYMPLSNSLFEIKFVEHENPFYQLGRLYVWEMECELFLYSSEKLQTGISPIDEIVTLQSTEETLFRILQENGDLLLYEDEGNIIQDTFVVSTVIPGADNEVILTEDNADQILDWSESNPFGDVKD